MFRVNKKCKFIVMILKNDKLNNNTLTKSIILKCQTTAAVKFFFKLRAFILVLFKFFFLKRVINILYLKNYYMISFNREKKIIYR